MVLSRRNTDRLYLSHNHTHSNFSCSLGSSNQDSQYILIVQPKCCIVNCHKDLYMRFQWAIPTLTNLDQVLAALCYLFLNGGNKNLGKW